MGLSKTSCLLRRAFLFFFIFSHAITSADTLKSILEQNLRPTMSQVKALMEKGIDIEQPSNHTFSLRGDINHLAKVIAILEWYYPGATWAPLGRDVVFLGDLLDGFYLSIGEAGRVSRLNCSSESFFNDSEVIYYQFLNNAGLNLNNPKSSLPFIIFDRTSFSDGSQSTTLIKAGYDYYKSRNRNPKDLIKRFNVFSTNNGQIASETTPEKFFRAVSKEFSKNHPYPQTILQVEYASFFTDTDPWHDSFGPFQRYGGQQLIGAPGNPSDIRTKRQILYDQSMALKMVSHPDFLALVKKEAKELGYRFPLHRGYKIKKVKPLTPRQIAEGYKKELEELVSGLKRKPEKTNYLSENGEPLFQWLESTIETENRNALILFFIQTVVLVHHEKKLLNSDLRRLIARALGALTLPDEEFFSRFIKFYKATPLLQTILSQRRDVFIESHRDDAEAVKRAYLYLERKMKSSCSIQLLKNKDRHKIEETKDVSEET